MVPTRNTSLCLIMRFWYPTNAPGDPGSLKIPTIVRHIAIVPLKLALAFETFAHHGCPGLAMTFKILRCIGARIAKKSLCHCNLSTHMLKCVDLLPQALFAGAMAADLFQIPVPQPMGAAGSEASSHAPEGKKQKFKKRSQPKELQEFYDQVGVVTKLTLKNPRQLATLRRLGAVGMDVARMPALGRGNGSSLHSSPSCSEGNFRGREAPDASNSSENLAGMPPSSADHLGGADEAEPRPANCTYDPGIEGVCCTFRSGWPPPDCGGRSSPPSDSQSLQKGQLETGGHDDPKHAELEHLAPCRGANAATSELVGEGSEAGGERTPRGIGAHIAGLVGFAMRENRPTNPNILESMSNGELLYMCHSIGYGQFTTVEDAQSDQDRQLVWRFLRKHFR